MKKLLAFFWMLAFCVSLFGCEMSPAETTDTKASEELTHTGYPVQVTLTRFYPAGDTIGTKSIEACDLAYGILDALSAMAETGDVAEALSDAIFTEDDSDWYRAAEQGTMWIEADGRLYRLDPDFETICRVERHMSAGVYLKMNDALRDMLFDAWYHHPRDSYYGTYQNGTLSLSHVYEAPSAVALSVKDIILSENGRENRILLAVQARQTGEVLISLISAQSDDNLEAGEATRLVLDAGESETVELTFNGWTRYPYYITITADNTKMEITVTP